MMGIQEPDNGKIFYTNINIAERIRRDHPLPQDRSQGGL